MGPFSGPGGRGSFASGHVSGKRQVDVSHAVNDTSDSLIDYAAQMSQTQIAQLPVDLDPISSTEGYMRQALAAAERAAACGEVPVGAIIVVGDEVVAVAHNERETLNDPTAHAEIVALRRASAALGGWRLTGADLYVTMEPCPMCAGAMVNARLRRLVYGCDDPKAGAVKTLYKLLDDARLNHRVEVVPNVLAGECGQILKSFFSRLRR
jgi:tRNA(adenine34) deaminase